MTVQTNTSMYNRGMVVQIDPWSKNPLLDDAMQSVPDTVRLATADAGSPPTMFVTGDVPPFLASGVDPQYLMSLPWKVRHAAAMEPDPTEVLSMLEQYATDGDAAIPTQGLADYQGRFSDWLSGKWTNPAFKGADPARQAEAEDAFYNSIFGDQDAAHAQRVAAVNANNPPRARTFAEAQAQAAIGRAQR